jgi:hypothetical protein
MVLRRTGGPQKILRHDKLAAKWEGPYRVYNEVGKGAYRLQELEGKNLKNTWNASHLKFFYC